MAPAMRNKIGSSHGTVIGPCALRRGRTPTHVRKGRDSMSRIPRPSHGLVAAAVALLTALVAAALPLAAMASDWPPLGS